MRLAGVYIFFCFVLPLPVVAQLSSYEIGGYVKYLFSTSEFPFVPERLNDHLIHARLNSRWYPAEPLRVGLDVRMRAFYGGSVEKFPGYLNFVKSHHDFSQLDAVLWNTKKSLGYAQVDRLWLDYSSGNLEATIGRQRIAWGTALVWNVIDLFNPQSILDFDYEEKPGADALRLQYYTGAVSKVEFSLKPGKTKNSTIAAGLFSVNVYAYDFYGLVGVRNNRWVAGGAWAGDMHGAGFRGEFLLSGVPPLTQRLANPFYSSSPAFSAALSADYTFSNSLYLHTEALFNSNGKTRNAGLFYQQALQAGLLSPARWSVFQEVSYDISPLVRGSMFGIYNPTDRSAVLVPQLTWSVQSNLDFTAIAFFATGKHFSEWGDYGTSVFGRVKFSF